MRYRGASDRREEPGNISVYVSDDERHGGLAPESCAVLMALQEKRLPYQQRKVRQQQQPSVPCNSDPSAS